MWGFQDSAVNTHSQEVLGFEFSQETEPCESEKITTDDKDPQTEENAAD